MKRSLALLAIFCLLLFGCTNTPQEAVSDPTPFLSMRSIERSLTTDADAVSDRLLIEETTDEDDLYDENSPLSVQTVYIDLADDATTIRYADDERVPTSDADTTGNLVIIRRAGTYRVSGTLTDGQIYIDTIDRVHVILDGARISSSSPALEAYGKGKKIITLASGTNNYLTSSSDQSAVFSDGLLTINGGGKLTVSSASSAIEAQRLKIIDCSLSVSDSGKTAIETYDSLSFFRANVQLHSDQKTIEGKRVFIKESTLTANGKGVYAQDIIALGSDLVLSGEEGAHAERLCSFDGGRQEISVARDAIVASGERGVVRLVDCRTLLSDGDDAIRAKTLRITSGSLFCYGMGTQLSVESIESFAPVWEVCTEILSKGATVTAKGKIVLDRESRFFVSIGVIGPGDTLHIGEKAYTLVS